MPPPRYTLVVSSRARRGLGAISHRMLKRLDEAILALAEHPRPAGCVKLKGSRDGYRIRVGDYRILYDVDDQGLVVTVADVAHRREVYRRR